MVAELGYEGDAGYVKDWAQSVAKSYPEFPELKAIVYFDDRACRTGAWCRRAKHRIE